MTTFARYAFFTFCQQHIWGKLMPQIAAHTLISLSCTYVYILYANISDKLSVACHLLEFNLPVISLCPRREQAASNGRTKLTFTGCQLPVIARYHPLTRCSTPYTLRPPTQPSFMDLLSCAQFVKCKRKKLTCTGCQWVGGEGVAAAGPKGGVQLYRKREIQLDRNETNYSGDFTRR